MRSNALIAVALALTVHTLSCSTTGLEAVCTEGLVRSCPCPTGGNGVQTCQSTRTYGACVCAAMVDASGPDLSFTILDSPVDVTQPDGGMCTGVQLAVGCTVGRCSVSAPLDALGDRPLVQLSEVPVPMEIVGDAEGPILCSVSFLSGLSSSTVLRLAIAVDTPIDPRTILFSYASPTARPLATSSVSTDSVSGFITAAGEYGVTRSSGAAAIVGVAGVDTSPSVDNASYLRNFSRQSISSAFYDGTRLYVGTGTRLLIFNGLPATPTTRPDLILGQPDFDTTISGASSSVFGAVNGIWSDGSRLLVATGNRVLIWRSVPTMSFQPADLVLGQSDFAGNDANAGGVSASSLNAPYQVDSDGTRVAVADALNHRALVWNTFPTAVGQPATGVIGQPTFSSNGITAGATPLYQAPGIGFAGSHVFIGSNYTSGLQRVPLSPPVNASPDLIPTAAVNRATSDVLPSASGIAFTAGGGLVVRDWFNARAGVFRTVPAVVGPFDFALGQPDPSRDVVAPTSASTLTRTWTATASHGLLLLPDGNRLLIWDQTPDFNYAPATRVLGQPGFTTNYSGVDYRGISASTLASPADVAADGTWLGVADRGNNRVLLYPISTLGNAPPLATVILGQVDERSYVPNGDQRSPNAARLSGPAGISLDGRHLIVADTENHRVLIWNTVPGATGRPADLVLGQPDATSVRPNRGRGDVSPRDGFSDTGADGFFGPTGVASDGTHLFVADRNNNRVLVWNRFPTATGQPADGVLGQPDFVSNTANRGQGGFSVAAAGFNLPTGVTLVGTDLWVADTENNRVVRWRNATTAPSPDLFLGQPDGVTIGDPNYDAAESANPGVPVTPVLNATNIIRPRGVSIADGIVFVSETDASRVHMFDFVTHQPLGVLGQTNDTSGTANTGGIGATSLNAPLGIVANTGRLFVADAENHRVVAYELTARIASGTAASLIVGQSTPLENGFNEASAAHGGVTLAPRGLARYADTLYIADTAHHRVLCEQLPLVAGGAPLRVLGQADDSIALPNRGLLPSARTLNSPRGVFVDARRVVVADSGNHRVLVFNRSGNSQDATLVLGQTDFGSVLSNRGGSASASTLSAPEAAYSDGTRLFIADTANHRVLIWNTFPTANGAAADIAIGQATLTDALGNRGSSVPGPDTIVFPTSVRVVHNALFIADSGNNRVLRFDTVPTASGAAATAVFGQPDFTSRQSAAVASDLTRLAGPTALTDDDTNIYVLDRDLGRIVAFDPGSAASTTPKPVFLGGVVLSSSLQHPAGIEVQRTPYFTSQLYVSDTGGNRIAIVGPASRLASP